MSYLNKYYFGHLARVSLQDAISLLRLKVPNLEPKTPIAEFIAENDLLLLKIRRFLTYSIESMIACGRSSESAEECSTLKDLCRRLKDMEIAAPISSNPIVVSVYTDEYEQSERRYYSEFVKIVERLSNTLGFNPKTGFQVKKLDLFTRDKQTVSLDLLLQLETMIVEHLLKLWRLESYTNRTLSDPVGRVNGFVKFPYRELLHPFVSELKSSLTRVIDVVTLNSLTECWNTATLPAPSKDKTPRVNLLSVELVKCLNELHLGFIGYPLQVMNLWESFCTMSGLKAVVTVAASSSISVLPEFQVFDLNQIDGVE